MQANDGMRVEKFLEGSYYCPSGSIITPNLPNEKDVIILQIAYEVMHETLGERKAEPFSDVVGQFIVQAINEKVAKEIRLRDNLNL